MFWCINIFIWSEINWSPYKVWLLKMVMDTFQNLHYIKVSKIRTLLMFMFCNTNNNNFNNTTLTFSATLTTTTTTTTGEVLGELFTNKLLPFHAFPIWSCECLFCDKTKESLMEVKATYKHSISSSSDLGMQLNYGILNYSY